MREVATIAALTALNQGWAVEEHARFALNVGLTREQITEVIMQMAVYAGMGPVMEALGAARRAFTDVGAARATPAAVLSADEAGGGEPSVESTRVAIGHRLYKALGDGDVTELRALLADEFEGNLSPGLPHGFGQRTYAGREAMLSDGWGAIGREFTMAPHVEDLFEAGDTLIGRGVYIGTAIATGKPVEARFAHFWRFDGDRIVAVHQVTDTALWEQALEP